MDNSPIKHEKTLLEN